MKFGAHMSIAGGLHNAFAHGETAGCNALQIFSKNQQQWRARPLTADQIDRFAAERQRHSDWPLCVHASYLINLASPNADLWQQSIAALADELERCDALGIPALVLHPGAHTGTGEAAGLRRVADAIARVFGDGHGMQAMLLLETTAGQGSSLGHRFEQLAWLLGQVADRARLGICVDTCHIFAAGYDIRTPSGYSDTMREFERTIGLEHLQMFHVNDSQKQLGSRVDRHTHIGKGQIGLEGFRALVNDPRMSDRPMILETPKGDDLAEDIVNLATLRGLRGAPDAAGDIAANCAPEQIDNAHDMLI